jgi:hypothetical protein
VRHDFDFFDAWRVNRKNTLDADAVGYFTYGEIGPASCAGHTDDDALKYLSTLFFTFDNFDVDAHGFARTQVRNLGFKLFRFDFRNCVHDLLLSEIICLVGGPK